MSEQMNTNIKATRVKRIIAEAATACEYNEGDALATLGMAFVVTAHLTGVEGEDLDDLIKSLKENSKPFEAFMISIAGE